MNWTALVSAKQLEEIQKESENKPVMIFKHSTRCATSKMSLDRLERNWNQDETGIKPYFLDLLNYRQVSNLVAEQYGVEHESPQVIVVSKGQAILDLSHFEIDYHSIQNAVKTEIRHSA